VVDFVRDLCAKTELPMTRVVLWLGIARGKFFDWRNRYGKANEHNAQVPRDHWIEMWERRAIIEYFDRHPLEGYRRLTFMMLDESVVAVSPATTYRVLSQAGRLDQWNRKLSKKGTGFQQPLSPHEHWHIDVSYLNLGGTFYYLCSVLDGASRAIVHWEIRESMKEREVECILERAKELYPEARPRIISDNGPQFIAKDFKEFIRISGMSHVRISPYYPQSNGKIERWHKTLKGVVRPAQPETLEPGSRGRHPLRRSLQPRSSSQRHRVHRAARLHGRQSARYLGRARSEAGDGARAAPSAPAGAARMTPMLRSLHCRPLTYDRPVTFTLNQDSSGAGSLGERAVHRQPGPRDCAGEHLHRPTRAVVLRRACPHVAPFGAGLGLVLGRTRRGQWRGSSRVRRGHGWLLPGCRDRASLAGLVGSVEYQPWAHCRSRAGVTYCGRELGEGAVQQ